MSAAPPPSSGVSQERLNQIAGRKLAALSVSVRPGSDRRTLEGELLLKTSQVLYPGTEQPIPRARFVVRGHDHLRFLEPPLAALGDVLFYDLDRPAALEERLAQLLRDRLVALDKAGAELRRLKLPARLDAQRLGLKATVRAAQQSFELLALPNETKVTRVELAGGPAFEVSADHPSLRLSDFPTLVDLELYLSSDVGRMRQTRAAAPAPAAPPPPPRENLRLEPVAPAPGQLTLGMLVQRFGADAVLAEGLPLELYQDFQLGPTRYRFTATRESGTAFQAGVSDSSGSLWSDLFDLEKFPGAARVVSLVARADVAPAPAPAAPGLPQPRAGQVWVMNVLIEQETNEEIRYVCTDTAGKPYGAARVLKRADFESAFVRHGESWRLLIVIDEVQADSVVYRQLDGQRQARGQPRRLATGILASTFLPEAAG